MKTLIIAAMVAGLALTAGASAMASDEATAPDAPKKRACFYSEQINGWRDDPSTPDDVVYLDVGVHDIYRLDMMGPCFGIRDALSIGVETRGGGSSICDDFDITLITKGPMGPERCHVRKITKLTPEERKALSASRRH